MSESEFDWENIKENCVPLKRGRNVQKLNMLSANTQAKGYSSDRRLEEEQRFDPYALVSL